jgi:hypothetical protein
MTYIVCQAVFPGLTDERLRPGATLALVHERHGHRCWSESIISLTGIVSQPTATLKADEDAR